MAGILWAAIEPPPPTLSGWVALFGAVLMIAVAVSGAGYAYTRRQANAMLREQQDENERCEKRCERLEHQNENLQHRVEVLESEFVQQLAERIVVAVREVARNGNGNN